MKGYVGCVDLLVKSLAKVNAALHQIPMVTLPGRETKMYPSPANQTVRFVCLYDKKGGRCEEGLHNRCFAL